MTMKVRKWRRRLSFTRDGRLFTLIAIGVGFAAVNTGNNLAYLLCSMLLALILVSGMLSDLSMRGLRLAAAVPEEIYAGRPALFGATLGNGKRRLASYSVALERAGTTPAERVLYVPRLLAGGERQATWEATLPARGCRRLPGLRVVTRFPFGLFLKSGPVVLDAEVVVFPAVGPVTRERLRELGAAGETTTRRRGRGPDLYNLRDYRSGDDPRLIHWRTSARAGTLTVRELEEETTLDTRLVLEGTGAKNPARLEAGLSEAASLAVHLLRAGAGVELGGAGVAVPLGRGRGHEIRLLTALALYAPPAGPVVGGAAAPAGAGLREIRVRLD
jgi:uncharacterized protein (DUF58 family)